MSPSTTDPEALRRVSVLRALRAAGPFVRRRLRPPQLNVEVPACTLRYRDRPDGRMPPLIDIYRPAHLGGADSGLVAPTALIVHGGGFVGGSRNMSAVGVLATDLVRRGFVVGSVDYCLARPFGPTLQDQVDDVRAALAWWHGSVGEHGGDPSRTALIGLSAGGGLSVLASEGAPFSHYVGVYGAYDLRLLPERWATASLLTLRARQSEHLRQSPLMRARFAQPALLVHGTADPLAPIEHSRRLLHHREQVGLSTQTVWIPGAQHGFLQDGPDDPHTRHALQAIGDYLDVLNPSTR